MQQGKAWAVHGMNNSVVYRHQVGKDGGSVQTCHVWGEKPSACSGEEEQLHPRNFPRPV